MKLKLCKVCSKYDVRRGGLSAVMGCVCYGCTGPYGQKWPRSACRCMLSLKGNCVICDKLYCNGKCKFIWEYYK